MTTFTFQKLLPKIVQHVEIIYIYVICYMLYVILYMLYFIYLYYVFVGTWRATPNACNGGLVGGAPQVGVNACTSGLKTVSVQLAQQVCS